jgi:hypothetical protein
MRGGGDGMKWVMRVRVMRACVMCVCFCARVFVCDSEGMFSTLAGVVHGVSQRLQLLRLKARGR